MKKLYLNLKYIATCLWFENGKLGLTKVSFTAVLISFLVMAWLSFTTGKSMPSDLLSALVALSGTSVAVKGIGVAREVVKNKTPQLAKSQATAIVDNPDGN